MPLAGLNVGSNWNSSINASYSLIQNIIRSVFLRWFIFDILSLKLWRPCWLTSVIQTSFSHGSCLYPLSLKRSPWCPIYFISETSNSLSVRIRSLKNRKSLGYDIFAQFIRKGGYLCWLKAKAYNSGKISELKLMLFSVVWCQKLSQYAFWVKSLKVTADSKINMLNKTTRRK